MSFKLHRLANNFRPRQRRRAKHFTWTGAAQRYGRQFSRWGAYVAPWFGRKA